MTIHFPDISHHNAGVQISNDIPILVAKATQGTSFVDPQFFNYKSRASQLGINFVAYHWLNTSSPSAQAVHCYSVVGRTPLMIDVENLDSNSNISDSYYVGINQIISFVGAYRSLGGIVHQVYLPDWYWAHKRENLIPLSINKLSLISSEYTSYSDTGRGWDPYGGVVPSIWQYTSGKSYGGKSICFNAYKGTVGQYWQMATNGISTSIQGDDMTPEQEAKLNELHLLVTEGKRSGPNQTSGGGVPIAYLPREFYELNKRMDSLEGLIKEPVTLPDGSIDVEALAQRVAELIMADEADKFVDALRDRLQS